MVAEACLAGRLGLADARVAARIRDLIRRAGLPMDLPAYPASALLRAMRQDKKVRNRQIHFVLPTQIGNVVVVPIPDPDLRAFLATRRPGT
jgi:3-dehydroquinate synthase